MSDDEVAAVHEAAHAVFAVAGEWTKLHGPVVLKGRGCGDVVMSTDVEAIGRSLAADPGFDRDLPRIGLVRALIAGPMAERLLMEHGLARLSEQDLSDASEGDYAVIADQLGRLDPPRPGLLARLEQEVREGLEQPALWSAVERLAAILRERRRLEAEEATAILDGIGFDSGLVAPPAEPEAQHPRRPRRLWLLAFILWEAWWAWEFLAAPSLDEEMRTVAALFLGLFLPGALILVGGAALLGYRAVRRKGRPAKAPSPTSSAASWSSPSARILHIGRIRAASGCASGQAGEWTMTRTKRWRR